MEDIKKFQEKVSKNEPSTPQEWQASNFSLLSTTPESHIKVARIKKMITN